MGARKIVDEQELVRWFEEGRTYAWMQQQYKEKYGLDVVSSFFGNFRRRRGLPRRINRDDELIPWFVKREHRSAYPLLMLRAEARRRAGFEMRAADQRQVPKWLAMLEENNAVVHYDPDTEEGFFYVPREPQDDDIIRRPRRKTTQRKAAD